MISNTLKDQATRVLYDSFIKAVASRIGRGTREAHQFVIGEAPGRLSTTLVNTARLAIVDILKSRTVYRAFPFVLKMDAAQFASIQDKAVADAMKLFDENNKAGLPKSTEKTVGEIFMSGVKALLDAVANIENNS